MPSLYFANLYIFIFFYLPPAAEGRGQEIIKCLPYVRLSVRLSRFCINLNISFIYEYIFTKFAGNVYGYENLSLKKFQPHFEKQNGRHRLLFENRKGALNLEIFQLASSNLHKSYMARKASLIVILT